MSEFASMPGPQAVLTAEQRRIYRGYPSSLVLSGIRIVSTAVDAGSTPTSNLRTGLVMGQIAASKKFAQYDPDATNGTQEPVGILWEERSMLNPDTGSAQDQTAQLIVGGGPVVASNVIGIDPYVRQILGQHILFDDMIPGEPVGWRGPVAKATDYTLVEADSGTIFTTLGAAGTVNFTLPTTIKKGFRAKFFSEAAGAMTITAPANSMVVFNDITATSVSFATANEIVGACCEIIANSDQTKYLFINHLGAEAQTITVV